MFSIVPTDSEGLISDYRNSNNTSYDTVNRENENERTRVTRLSATSPGGFPSFPSEVGVVSNAVGSMINNYFDFTFCRRPFVTFASVEHHLQAWP